MRIGLRARVVANLLAAVVFAFGLIALTSIAFERSARRRAGEDRANLAADLVAAQLAACGDETCVRSTLAEASRAGLGARLAFGSSCERPRLAETKNGPVAWRVDRLIHGRVLSLSIPDRRDRTLRADEARLLGALAAESMLVVLLGLLLFERGFVRRLKELDQALGQVERLDLESPFLLAQSGDELGRVGGTARRMAERIREDKLRSIATIAELKRANDELVETREGLVRSEKLATVGRLAAGVAHEIGNPVAAILGYLGLMKGQPAAEQQGYLERIERETGRIDRIVRDLLDFARPRPPRVGPTSLAEVVESACRLVEPQPRFGRMRLALGVPADLPAVLAERHGATQVLVNLLLNAADACGGEGRARIDASARVTGAGAVGAEVELSVSDSGPGIRDDDLPRLFDPFFTTKSPGEGTGLGLAICHRLMESFGGSIRAENVPEGGARFTLRFQRAPTNHEKDGTAPGQGAGKK